MDKKKMINEFIEEAELVIKGLVSAGHTEQFARIAFDVVSDFFLKFPQDKQFFALSAEQGMLKYYAFCDELSAKKTIKQFKNNGDFTEYRIVSRTIAEMVGREFEFYQYLEEISESDEDAAKFTVKQQEIIDFLFPKQS